MPYAHNREVRLYYEVDGEGLPLVLGHGLGSDLNSWRRFGYADALKDDYQLILPDFRGHGRSDKPHDPSAYGGKMVDDVVAVLDDLGISQAHYMGYSMGAGVGFRLAKLYPERFISFILGGMSPYRSSAADLGVDIVQMEGFKLLRDDPEAYLARREQQLGRPITLEERSALLANDPEALIAFLTANPDNPLPNNEDLSRLSAPCLLYTGDLDPRYAGSREAATRIPHATSFYLPGLDHVPVFARSDLVLPRIKSFLAEVAKRGG